MTLLQMSVMGTILIGLMILLRKITEGKLSPGCYLWLWLVIGLRMLIPIRIESPFSIYQLLDMFNPIQMAVQYVPAIPERIYQMGELAEQSTADMVSVNWLTVVWLVGAIVVFALIFTQHWYRRMHYNASLPVENAFILAWQADHKLYRSYQIRQSQQIDTPLTYGVICPVILLPANQKMEDGALDLVLTHEWHHIRHGDVLWQWMLVVLCSIYWFHPAVWLMSVFCRQDLELFCDCATVGHMKTDRRKEYALLLLNQASSVPQIPLFSQFCFTGYHRMEERVKYIMKQKPATWKTILVTLGLLCVCGVCFAASAPEVNSRNQWIAVDLAVDDENEAVTKMVWPVASEDAVVTLDYGVRVHPVTGEEMTIDHICIGGVEKGTDIIAAASGIVKEAGFDTQKGNYLIVQCADNLETHYWHCEKLLVKEGEYVSAYDKIATMGQTGDATGPCLSFAVYQNGEVCALLSWLK